MSKDEMESLLVSYGVVWTDCLADKLLEVMKEEVEKAKNGEDK